MRTTLKRRAAGLAAETNGRANGDGRGNGRVVLPPVAPPPPPPFGPTARFASPRRSPLRIGAKVLGWIVILLLMAGGALAGGAWLFINQSVKAVVAHTPEARAAQEVLDLPLPGAPTVAMVIGYDQRAGIEASDVSRSDTIMLIRANPDQKIISMLSFPRDLIVEIPACKGQGPWRARINEAYTLCGPRGTLETVKALTGIRVNYLITVNFRGFKQIVDKVGGVYMDVDRRYFNDNSGFGPDYARINLQPGYQKLPGGAALDYVRYRHTDSDFFRIRRQQEFVKAFKQQISGFWSVTKVPGIVNTITENVEVGVGGGKSLDVDTVYGYAKLAYELPAGNFVQVQINPDRVAGFSELSTDQGSLDDAVRQFLNPDPKAAVKATDTATRKKPKRPSAPPPADTTIEVLNGNGVAGSGDEAAFLLSQRGYQVLVGGNARNFDYFHTKVLYDPDVKGAHAAARVVAQLFGDGEVEAAKADSGVETMLLVVVGETFHGTLGPGVADKTQRYEPPKVVNDAAAIRPLIRRAQRKAGDLELYVPTVREQSSSLDATVPLRVYRVNKHDALRLVYRTSAGEYWGIQQTTWTDAPLLDGASVTRRIKGREYRLFYNGSKLHIVAFEENDGAYWVVNTLLDQLSNETMLAIAKGMRPLGSAS